MNETGMRVNEDMGRSEGLNEKREEKARGILVGTKPVGIAPSRVRMHPARMQTLPLHRIASCRTSCRYIFQSAAGGINC